MDELKQIIALLTGPFGLLIGFIVHTYGAVSGHPVLVGTASLRPHHP